MRHAVWILILCIPLLSCSSLKDNPETDREAVCNELTHRIIFNAATGDQILATHERANMDTINKSYRAERCDS